jgi:NADPH-dependent 2,4-dienoyl-CoA reductase/sulfur reductase-like enzyme
MTKSDLIIIGAGPAGIAAAMTASQNGARVLLIDEQCHAGGQIYRNVKSVDNDRAYLGADFFEGRQLVRALENPKLKSEFCATVWRIEKGPRVLWSRNGESHISTARHVLLATGAQERPTPFPGWTLPGVMPAGAAQILMKTSGLLPRNSVLAGSGPLLYLIAAQMIDAGEPPQALVETQTPKMMLRALQFLPRAMLNAPTLFKGLGLIRKIVSSGVPRYPSSLSFHAETTKSGDICFRFKSNGKTHHLNTPLLLIHQGIVPSTHISRAAGIPHRWNDAQKALQPNVNSWGKTDIPGFYIAGDGAGIGGAEAAQAAGQLAALDILHKQGLLTKESRNRKSISARARLRRALALRPFLDAAYEPLPEFLVPKDETIVCRCEEVSAAEICAAIKGHANGPRKVKTATRAGMGPCQGRMCELSIQGILTSFGAKPSIPRARSPIKPIRLSELAALASHAENHNE